jgi:hypothetical protein
LKVHESEMRSEMANLGSDEGRPSTGVRWPGSASPVRCRKAQSQSVPTSKRWQL